LQRKGSVFTSALSHAEKPASEADWKILATVDLYLDPPAEPKDYKSPAVLDRRMYFGMFVNSGSETRTATAEFQNVKITRHAAASMQKP
jgi:hypothetical protein